MKMPHFPIPYWKQNIKYDLANINKLLKVLGDPQLKLPPIIHVAGTNGKGSSVAMLKSIFEVANYRVHSYTSPHLLEFNERIVLAGEKISDSYLFEICEKTRLATIEASIEPTFFEGVTASAFLAYANVPADILILETGIGGRLDATNIVPKPLITLITPISYDHMEYLGATLSAIASEKAGIIKPYVPCVISCQVHKTYEILLAKCSELEAPSFCYEHDFGLNKTAKGFFYLSKNSNYEFSAPALRGDHQLINAASVIATIGLINKKFNITNEQIDNGLKNTMWPARIQKIDPVKYSDLAANNIQIWVDGAHNSGGAQVLAAWIKDNLKPPIYLILGMTKDRNIEDFCNHFRTLITKGYGVKVLSEPMSYSAAIISQRTSTSNIDFTDAESLDEAIKEINKLCHNVQANIIITGSLFLAADFLKLISDIST